MNKKYLSTILLGALLASSTGMFTSCKDYDDDIDSLNGRMDAVEKELSELNTKFGSLAYVKSVSFVNGELVVTDQTGNQTTYDIPDMNTIYTFTVTQEGNKAIITLTPSDGNAQSQTVTFTDTTLDPSLFWMDEEGVVWYGPKDKKDECKQTGMTVPVHSVTVIKLIQNGVTIGWDIAVDNVTTHLSILDVLPITGFSWIPEDYYNGIEAVAFRTYEYSRVTSTNDADTTYSATGMKTLSSFPGIAEFYVNPSSASTAQIVNGANGATVLYKGATNHTTRADINAKATIDIESGVLKATIIGDLNQAETTTGKLDMLALQLTTTAGNKFTTNYFAVYNEKENVSFELVDTCAISGGKAISAKKLATSWNIVKGQQAIIDSDNMPVVGNADLVKTIQYKDAIAGIDLNTLVDVTMTKANRTEKIDWVANRLKTEFTLCSYKVAGTDQIEYAVLKGSTLTATNYDGTNESCIGKTPIVKVTVRDTNNKDAEVAVAYLKLLYVGNSWKAAPDYTAEVSQTLEKKWKCFVDSELDFTTTVEYMSTKVYPKVGSKLGLPALSKEEFANIYKFVTDQSDIPANFKSKYITSIREKTDITNNEGNHQIEFNINESDMGKQKDGTYTFYGVYKIADAAAAASSKYREYPKYVAIPYTIIISEYPTLQNGLIKGTDAYRIGQVWAGDVVTCKGGTSSSTPNGVALYLDLKEAINFDQYENYELEMIQPTTGPVAMFGNQWCGGHGVNQWNWVVLKTQLVDANTVDVPVIVKKVLCNNDKVNADTVQVKFMNPANLTLTKTAVDLKDGITPITTEDLRNLIIIRSSKDGSELYKDGRLTALGEKILGRNVTVTLSKGKVTPDSWDQTQNNLFTWDNSASTVTWNAKGQTTIVQGQKATCEVDIVIEYGKVISNDVLEGCTAQVRIGGSKLTGKIIVNVLNTDDYNAKYPMQRK